jgi:hypothetical protein
MDEILASVQVGNGRAVHIATLARETIIDAEAEHLGFHGYFIFEANDLPGETGINILGKLSSFEAALRVIEIWQNHVSSSGPSSSRSNHLSSATSSVKSVKEFN